MLAMSSNEGKFIYCSSWCSNKWALLTKREVKIIGNWTKFILHKKEQSQYLANFTERAWSIKDLLYGQKNTKEFEFIMSCSLNSSTSSFPLFSFSSRLLAVLFSDSTK